MSNAITCPHCQKTDSVIRYGYTSTQTPRGKCKACNKTFPIVLEPIIGDEKRTFDLIRRHDYQLKRVREKWCLRPRSKRPITDRKNITVVLDGSHICDIPTFHIALGEAVNGSGGYYGGCLDALDDCICCGGFGLIAPFTLEIIGLEQVRNSVESSENAWHQWKRLCWMRDYPEEFEKDEAYLVAIQNGEIEDLENPYDTFSYFELILDILTQCGVTVREHLEQ
jgi:RNAse (barnase) inhibitor barstar